MLHLQKVLGSILVAWILLFCSKSGCGSKNFELKYVWGDALVEPQAKGPDGNPYPWDAASKIAGKSRIPRSLFEDGDLSPPALLTPEETRAALLSAFTQHEHVDHSHRAARSSSEGSSDSNLPPPPSSQDGGCVPSRLCETTYNTTAPMYGISLTSGKPVTIVQKFPDLLQQVVYQVCKSEECDVIQGRCVQTYLPYLFLVIPLGPVTLTGQDYVLVESGCACRPKYAKKNEERPQLPFIQPFNNTGNNSTQNHSNNLKPRSNKRF